MWSFLCASFEPFPVGETGLRILPLVTDHCLYPQFSLSLLSKSDYHCEICPLYQKWAIENCMKHSKLKCKGYNIEKILSCKFQMKLNGMHQVYEHAISKAHKEAISSISSNSDSLITAFKKHQAVQDKGLQSRTTPKQSNLDFFFKRKANQFKVMTASESSVSKLERVDCHHLWDPEVVENFKDDKQIRCLSVKSLFLYEVRVNTINCRELGHSRCLDLD